MRPAITAAFLMAWGHPDTLPTGIDQGGPRAWRTAIPGFPPLSPNQ